ncbi:MAG: Omp28-related outer membrane protein [Muribaculaceae bacterium]|nr:Omp28-related outer membrane protein [Muribaculaceae bacterium]
MKRLFFISLLALLLSPLSLSAQGFPLTFGNVPDTETKPKIVNLAKGGGAISFTPADLVRLQGHHITKVRCHIYKTEHMTGLELWVKKRLNEEPCLASATVETPQAGWNEVVFDSPVEITGQDSLFVGFTYTQQGICYALTYSTEKQKFAGDCYILNSAFWDDYSDELPPLCIEGIVDDFEMAEEDLFVHNLAVDKRFYNNGEGMMCSAILRNFGSKPAVNPYVTFTVQGEEKAVDNIDATIPCGGWYKIENVRVEAPRFDIGDAVLLAEPSLVRSGIDAAGRTYVNSFSTLLPRRVVVEEGTGTWCSFCTRGIVGIRDVLAAHPDDFIPIAIHWNDEMDMTDYNDFMKFKQYPSCNVDRFYWAQDPNYDDLNNMYLLERDTQTYADFEITGGVYNDGTIDVSATLSFNYDAHNCDYRLALVVTEDYVKGYPQHNGYSGGKLGPMGGFEDLPTWIPDYEHMHVARYAFPSYGLDNCIVLKDIKAGETYRKDYRFCVRDNVQSLDNLAVNALLINGHDGTIINARILPLSDLGAISAIETSADLVATDYFDISGRQLQHPEGIHIVRQHFSDGTTTSALRLAR